MTKSFPLLKLPLIPLEVIIEQLDFIDLVQLSMKSTKFKHILEVLKLSVRSLHLYVMKISCMISILRNRNICYIDAWDSVPKNEITEHVNIQGEPVQIWKDGTNTLKVKSDLSKLATLEAITKHVMSISKVAKYSLTYKNDVKAEIRSLFIWQQTTQLDQLKVCVHNGTRVPISPEDLTFILDGISVECLLLNVSCPGFKYQRPIRHTKIHIRCSSWIDFEQFSLGPETIIANFYDQKVSNDVLNRLIKDWKEGKYLKLREVEFIWYDNDQRSLAMVREHEARWPKTILPNRNIEQLKGLSMNHLIEHQFWRFSVFYRVRLSVEEDFGLNGIHLEDQD